MTSPPQLVGGADIADDEQELGFVSGFFGVKGEVRLHLHNRASAMVGNTWSVILVGPDGRRWQTAIRSRPGAGKRVFGTIGSVGSLEAAEPWKDFKIVVKRSELPQLEEGEFYVWQVQGMSVFVGDERIGRVRDLHNTHGGDMFEISRGRKAEIYVPVLNEFIVEMDFEGKRLVLTAEAVVEDHEE